MRYRIEITRAAERDLAALPRDIVERVRARIESLADNPRPYGSKKLAAPDSIYRIRIGDYRLIYQIRDRMILVIVVRVRHRRDAYR